MEIFDMKKLFNAIRHGDFDGVKEILENYPESVNEAAAPPPKKDKNLSPLQVALKIGEFDIAKYLIEHGADVNYMEPKDENEKYEWRMPVIQDAIKAVFFKYEGITANIEAAEKATEIVRDLLERGADPNVISWQTIVRYGETETTETKPDHDAIGACISGASRFISSDNNPDLRDIAAKKLTYLLDLLLEHGADIESWADRPVSAHHKPEETSRKLFIDDFVPVPDKTVEIIKRGRSIIKVGDKPIEPKKGDRKETLIIKGGVDNNAKMRAFMQEFCQERGLLGYCKTDESCYNDKVH